MYPWIKMYTIFYFFVDKSCKCAVFSTFNCVEKVTAKNEQKTDPNIFFCNFVFFADLSVRKICPCLTGSLLRFGFYQVLEICPLRVA